MKLPYCSYSVMQASVILLKFNIDVVRTTNSDGKVLKLKFNILKSIFFCQLFYSFSSTMQNKIKISQMVFDTVLSLNF